ncbi:LysE family transporter [Thiotrichales bacterium 19S3-7]|nr:LysE family transporter [Thiotrichales bacterium 19S3-7]MCF6801065.1 LysE family transporter [Thiotrichales bacterium 19S3-11]
MFETLLTLGVLNLLAAMGPGPDFAVVMKNTLLYDRHGGIFTALGIASAILIHVSYCLLGLATLISHSLWLFDAVAILGGSYLIYLGINALKEKVVPMTATASDKSTARLFSRFNLYREGFLTNLLNPKCILFFIAMFTLVPYQDFGVGFAISILIELFLIVFLWFCSLSLILSYPKLKMKLDRYTIYIVKVTGVILILLGLFLFVEIFL